jgi:hypothetical protein
MASNTETIASETGTVGRDVQTPRRPPRSRGRRALPWAAMAVATIATGALAVSVLTGGGDSTEQPANRAALQHEAERYVESLESRAASVPGANRAALQHEAERYVEWLESRAASVSGDGPTDGSLPGNLPALEHQAEQYVDWLESRAGSISETTDRDR